MNEHTQKPEDQDIDEQDQSAADEGDEQGEGQAQDSAFDQLQSERDDLHSKLLRSIADYQNLARRAEMGASQARHQTISDFARALLPTIDQFDAAMDVDPDKVSVESLLQGMKMVQAELRKVLESHGVQRVDAQVGDEFNANVHEALMQQPAEGVKSGHITGQFQPGYVMGERTIRPAKVTVAP